MTTYVTQAPTHAGGSIVLTAPGGATGDFAPTGTGIGLLVQWGTAPGTITLPVSVSYDNQVVGPRTYVPGNGQLILIPLPSTVYGVGTTAVQYSTVTGVTVGSIQVAT